MCLYLGLYLFHCGSSLLDKLIMVNVSVEQPPKPKRLCVYGQIDQRSSVQLGFRIPSRVNIIICDK